VNRDVELTVYVYHIGETKKIKIMLLAGGDLMASFGHPGVWSAEDVKFKMLILNLMTNTLTYIVTSHCGQIWLYYYRENRNRCIWISTIA
jgi:hypothetical protein